jgi:hypothetical protein
MGMNEQDSPPDEEGTAAAKRGRGGQTTTISPIAKILWLYDLPALTVFGLPLLVRRGIQNLAHSKASRQGFGALVKIAGQKLPPLPGSAQRF